MRVTVANARRAVDELGHLKAKIAELTEQEARLKATLVAYGKSPIDGELFRSTITTTIQDRLDMQAVREHLSPQFIRANTRTVQSTRINVVARVRDAA